jgi:putative endonuclease
MMGTTMDTGAHGEEIAARYLLLSGYHILERNYRAGRLEIDIVAERDGCLVFAEVKMRRTGSFGSALEALGRGKLENLREAAMSYICCEREGRAFDMRFDLIAIDLEGRKGRMALNHLEGIT